MVVGLSRLAFLTNVHGVVTNGACNVDLEAILDRCDSVITCTQNQQNYETSYLI